MFISLWIVKNLAISNRLATVNIKNDKQIACRFIFDILRILSEDVNCTRRVENEQNDVGDISRNENNALPTLEFAKHERRNKRKARNRKTEREVYRERLRVHGKRSAAIAHVYKRAKRKNESQVDNVCSDDIAHRQVRFLLDNWRDCRDQFG